MVPMNERADNLPIEEKEIRILIKDIENHKGFRAMLFLILATGMSLDDALSIKIKDIDYPKSQIYIYDTWTGRGRQVKLNESVIRAIDDYQDGRRSPVEALFALHRDTAITWLYDASQERIGHPVSWMAIRRTWAVLCFKNGVPFKDMIESSGTTAQQLAVWSLWEKGNGGRKDPPDLLAGLLK